MLVFWYTFEEGPIAQESSSLTFVKEQENLSFNLVKFKGTYQYQSLEFMQELKSKPGPYFQDLSLSRSFHVTSSITIFFIQINNIIFFITYLQYINAITQFPAFLKNAVNSLHQKWQKMFNLPKNIFLNRQYFINDNHQMIMGK